MSYDTRGFAPQYKSTVPGVSDGALSPSVTVSASTVSAPSGRLIGQGDQIRIANTSTAWAFVNFGVIGSVPAATAATGYPIPPGDLAVVTVNPEVSGATVILASGTGDVIFTRGTGR